MYNIGIIIAIIIGIIGAILYSIYEDKKFEKLCNTTNDSISLFRELRK